MSKPNDLLRRTVQITITENCNLDCSYCYEKNKNTQVMPLEKIQEIFHKSFKESTKFDEIEFDFHGGEPALVFPVLREACEWLWAHDWNKPYLCFASTNGTLVHGKIQEWFEQHKQQFWLGLSVDGTPDMHNINRSDSYYDIDFNFFLRTWPEQTCKMTISPATLPSLYDGIVHIHKLGFKYMANLAYGIDWPAELREIYCHELSKLVHFYLTNPEYELPNLFSMNMKGIGHNFFFPERKESKKWCGSGETMICYACDGNRYPCQAFMPSTSIQEGYKLPTKIDFDSSENFDDPECAACPIHDVCPTCYAHNYMATGTLYKRPKDLCDFRKIEAMAASYLQGAMILDPMKYSFSRGLTPLELKCVAKGVEIVQNAFKNVV